MPLRKVLWHLRAIRQLWKNPDLDEELGAELTPVDELITDPAHDDTELAAARDAVMRGEWEPAARLLRATGTDWDRRERRLWTLADVAVEHDSTWLHSWLAAHPEDPHAVCTHAAYLVGLAWSVRGAYYAKYTSMAQFEGFYRILAEAEPVCWRATALDRDDPTPWSILLILAFGAGAERAEFWRRFRELRARDPYHRAGHEAALQYLCDKWHGSHEEMFGFAQRAVDEAPVGSSLPMLGVQAWKEYAMAKRKGTEDYREAHEAVDRVLGLWADTSPTHARAACDRARLIEVLVEQKRATEAMEQLRVIGPYVCQHVFDSKQDFLARRAGVVAAAALGGFPP